MRSLLSLHSSCIELYFSFKKTLQDVVTLRFKVLQFFCAGPGGDCAAGGMGPCLTVVKLTIKKIKFESSVGRDSESEIRPLERGDV